ncbi:MAG: nucleotide exchange factor GrpE [Pseudomonadales bacterium]|nr:nucleotide exchange factor GrpE [Pseudomonadales bacterium]MBO7006269.1 nucleotide exchange factor GrpE [Pseudomonadales bacterium]
MALPDEEKIPENEQAEHEEHPTEIPEPEEDEASQEEAVDSEQNAAEGLQKVLEEVEKYKDAALRAEAEMQNMQRRTARDVENAHKFALEKFLQNLLPVVDSMEKAVEAAEQASENEDDAMLEGNRLCHKLLVDVLGKEGIEVIDPMGEPFDPNEHQAMSMVENPDMEPNSVFAVVQKGYRLNGRLVRAAMVMVTKAPAATEEDS